MIEWPSQVLIIDDDVTLASALAEGLGEMGLVCRVATTGNQALHIIAEWEPAAALIDIRLPDMDGIELLRQARATNPEIAPLMLTALDDRVLAVEAMKLGALDYLVKPVRVNELSLSLHRALTKSRELQRKEKHQVELYEDIATRVDFTLMQCAKGHDGVRMVYVRHNPNEVVWECPTCHRVVTLSRGLLLPGQTRIYEGDLEWERIRSATPTSGEPAGLGPRPRRLAALVCQEAPKHGLTSREVMSAQGAWLKVAMSLAEQGQYPVLMLKNELISYRLRSIGKRAHDSLILFTGTEDDTGLQERLLVIATSLLELIQLPHTDKRFHGLECPHCGKYGVEHLGDYSISGGTNAYFQCTSCERFSYRWHDSSRTVPGGPLHRI